VGEGGTKSSLERAVRSHQSPPLVLTLTLLICAYSHPLPPTPTPTYPLAPPLPVPTPPQSFPKTGEVYEGWWERGSRHGRGRLVNGEITGGKNSRFDGEFEKGRAIAGIGKMVYADKRGEREGSGGWYAGHLLKGLRHGPGVMVYGNGDIYDGEWKSHLRHGFGCMIKGDEIYEGIWVYDEAGDEGNPQWDPYLEIDPSILQERVREQVREVCHSFALPHGKIEIICACVGSDLLRTLLGGTLKPMLVELEALRERESKLLALDDLDAAHELAAIRHQGKAVYTRCHAIVSDRAWDALPEAARYGCGRVHVIFGVCLHCNARPYFLEARLECTLM